VSNYVLVPEALVVAGALALLLMGRTRRRLRWWLPTAATALVLMALLVELWAGSTLVSFFGGAFVQDRFALFAKAAVLLAATLAIAGVKAAKTRRSVRFFPALRVGRYAVTALAMGVILYFLSGFLLPTDLGTLAFGFRLLGVVAVGAGFYFGALFATDGKFRSMAMLLLTKSA